jgi:hypothetical protein
MLNYDPVIVTQMHELSACYHPNSSPSHMSPEELRADYGATKATPIEGQSVTVEPELGAPPLPGGHREAAEACLRQRRAASN